MSRLAIKTGIQLYSVRKSLARDPYGTLAKVAEIGYRYVEAANHNAAADPGVGFGVPAREMRKTLDDLGLKLVGCHVAPLELDVIDRSWIIRRSAIPDRCGLTSSHMQMWTSSCAVSS